jgi:hypothetical protein
MLNKKIKIFDCAADADKRRLRGRDPSAIAFYAEGLMTPQMQCKRKSLKSFKLNA